MDKLGKAEITNNIYSLAVQTSDGGQNPGQDGIFQLGGPVRAAQSGLNRSGGPTEYNAEASAWLREIGTLENGRNVLYVPKISSQNRTHGGSLYLA